METVLAIIVMLAATAAVAVARVRRGAVPLYNNRCGAVRRHRIDT